MSSPTLEPRRVSPVVPRSTAASLWPLVLASIALHVAVALWIAASVSHPQPPAPELPVEEIDVILGESVPELVVTNPAPAADLPTPPEPTPPPPEPPKPELPAPEPPTPEPPPPPPRTPAEFVEPQPTPKPSPPRPRAEAKPAAPRKPASAPAGAKVGPEARDGVVGGNAATGRKNATPGAAAVGNRGWHLPRPGYPTAARIAHLTGSGTARITTDASGRVVSCEVSGLPAVLAANTRSFARSAWKGPPNSTRTVPVIYRLD